MLHMILWKWQQHKHRDTYTSEHVNIVASMLRNHLRGIEHRIVCITDEQHGILPPTETYQLWGDYDDLPNVTGRHLPSCYRRLKLFDYGTQLAIGAKPGDRLSWLDLDSIVLGPLNEVFGRINASGASFAGWGVRGTYHATVYNGSFVSITCGEKLQHIWSAFNPKVSPKETLAAGYLGSDQGWLSRHFSKSEDVCPIRFPDFASYPREVRRTGVLDRRTRVVLFHGSRKPWMPEEQKAQPWIRNHWRSPT